MAAASALRGRGNLDPSYPALADLALYLRLSLLTVWAYLISLVPSLPPSLTLSLGVGHSRTDLHSTSLCLDLPTTNLNLAVVVSRFLSQSWKRNTLVISQLEARSIAVWRRSGFRSSGTQVFFFRGQL